MGRWGREGAPGRSLWLVAPVLLALGFGTGCKSGGEPASGGEAKDKETFRQPATAEPAASAKVDIDDPASCRPCHEAIVAEWKQSMHARAHHSRDPIYAGVRQVRMKRMKKEGAALAEVCAGCHTPRSGGKHEGPIAEQGVSCATCHNVAEVHPPEAGKKGAAALVWAAPDTLLGPHDLEPSASPAHGTGKAPAHMREPAKLCLACHGELSTKAGVALCTTGTEWAKLGDAASSCTECHMASAAGPASPTGGRETHASHFFAGPHRAWYNLDRGPLEDAISLSGELDAEGALTIRLSNEVQHDVPTGFPGRTVIIRAVGFGEDGAEVWRSWKADPMKEDPGAVLNKVYVDAEGKPTLAAFATSLKRDSRLKPEEERALSYQVPPEVKSVKAEVIFRLMPPPLASKIGLEGANEAEPRVGASVEIARK